MLRRRLQQPEQPSVLPSCFGGIRQLEGHEPVQKSYQQHCVRGLGVCPGEVRQALLQVEQSRTEVAKRSTFTSRPQPQLEQGMRSRQSIINVDEIVRSIKEAETTKKRNAACQVATYSYFHDVE